MGSYEELLQKHGDFSDFIKNHTYTEEENENPDDSNQQYKSKIKMRSKGEKSK